MTNGRWPVAEAAGVTESVIGAGGRRLDEACQDGAEAFLGITVTGRPNVFPLDGPNTKLSGNSIIYILEGQIRYVASALPALREQRLAWVDVRPDVQAEFDAWVRAASHTSVWETGCHNRYTTDGPNISNWPVQTCMCGYCMRHFDVSDFALTPGRIAAPRAAGLAGA